MEMAWRVCPRCSGRKARAEVTGRDVSDATIMLDAPVRPVAPAPAPVAPTWVALLSASSGPVWWVVHPLATHVVAATTDAAEVEVWTVTVLAATDVAAPQTEWLTVTVDLALTRDGWRVESIRDRPGPSPMLGPRDQPWDAAPFTDALDGFDRLEGGPLDEPAQVVAP